MHIPDGMLSNAVAASTDVGALGFIAYGTFWIKKYFDQKKIVLMAVLGALIFALQMLNFPVAGGTSGHFAGGALAGIVLGPIPAMIVVSAVLLVQSLLFSDGGVLALGANIINMAILAPFIGYSIFMIFNGIRANKTLRVTGASIAGWVACLVAACAAAIEVWASGHAALGIVLTSMAGWHALIGIGEGLITGGNIAYLLAVRPDLIEAIGPNDATGQSQRPIRPVIITLTILALVAASGSFLASSNPDGLEFVYFNSKVGKPFAETSLLGKGSLFAGYGVRGISNDALAGALAGIVGLAVTGLLLWVLFARHKKNAAIAQNEPAHLDHTSNSDS